jgi:hypothetical protein
MAARSYILQNAYPRRPDFTFRVYDGEGRKRRDQASHLRWLADLLDTKFRLPGGFRVGWDGILGLIPGAGDLATGAVSFYILVQAALLGAPPALLARMGLNLLIDNAFSLVPVVGNLFDFVWKANTKNMALLDRYLEDPRRTVRRSKWAIGFTLAAVVAFALLLVTAAVVASVAAFRWLFSGGGW